VQEVAEEVVEMRNDAYAVELFIWQMLEGASKEHDLIEEALLRATPDTLHDLSAERLKLVPYKEVFEVLRVQLRDIARQRKMIRRGHCNEERLVAERELARLESCFWQTLYACDLRPVRRDSSDEIANVIGARKHRIELRNAEREKRSKTNKHEHAICAAMSNIDQYDSSSKAYKEALERLSSGSHRDHVLTAISKRARAGKHWIDIYADYMKLNKIEVDDVCIMALEQCLTYPLTNKKSIRRWEVMIRHRWRLIESTLPMEQKAQWRHLFESALDVKRTGKLRDLDESDSDKRSSAGQ